MAIDLEGFHLHDGFTFSLYRNANQLLNPLKPSDGIFSVRGDLAQSNIGHIGIFVSGTKRIDFNSSLGMVPNLRTTHVSVFM